jgi:hypothetical protein
MTFPFMRAHAPIQQTLLQDLAKEAALYKALLDDVLRDNLYLLQCTQMLDCGPSLESLPEAMGCKPLSTNEEPPFVKEEISSISGGQIFVEPKKRRSGTRDRSNEEEEENDTNETKNIPKNYGKAILSFIQRNTAAYKDILVPILKSGGLSVNDLLLFIKRHKRQVNSISYLKLIWGHKDESNPITKCVRILSFIFLRKHCLAYIFNSRVKNYGTHIKYRGRIVAGLLNPEEFTCIKQF